MRATGIFQPRHRHSPEDLLGAIHAELQKAKVRLPLCDASSVAFRSATVTPWPAFPLSLHSGQFTVELNSADVRVLFSAEAPSLPSAGIQLFLGSAGLIMVAIASSASLWAIPAVSLLAGLLFVSVRSSAVLWLEEVCSKAEHRLDP